MSVRAILTTDRGVFFRLSASEAQIVARNGERGVVHRCADSGLFGGQPEHGSSKPRDALLLPLPLAAFEPLDLALALAVGADLVRGI